MPEGVIVPQPESGTRPIPIAPGDGFRRVPKKAEVVAQALVRDIVRQGRQPGTALASEAEMLQQYGVARETIREALRLLEAQGLVRIRRGPGGGPRVCTVDPANMGRMTALYYHMAGATYRDLLEAWIVSESLAASRAARNPEAAARRAALAPYVAGGDDLHGADDELEAFMRSHMSFHAAVAALGQNRVLELNLQAAGQIVSHHVEVTDDPRALGRDLGDDHRHIARVIIAGLPIRAAALMEEHIGGLAEAAQSRLGSRLDEFIEWH